jgi:primosomal protein N' (replication factor Y)
VRLVSVAVPVPYLDSLTYQVPADHPGVPPVGARVRVPVGSREVVGCVVAHGGDYEEGKTVRELIAVLDDTPFLPEPVIRLCEWVADYYMAGIGDTVGAAMPPGSHRKSAIRTRRVITATAHGLSAVQTEARDLTTRQQNVLALLASSPAGLSSSVLRERGAGADVIRRMVTKGLVAVHDEQRERDPFEGAAALADIEDGGRVLTAEQEGACHTLESLLDERRFRVALLHGVTGSGKTEIYLRAARHAWQAGRRTLILVPEIALTPSITSRFRAAFGTRVAIQHSGLSDGERHDQWQRIRRGDVDVVVGTRSAVFAPLPDPGLVVVDEEHDGSYKQEESPRYHGRDVAIVRAQSSGALVILGSATPSMESYQNAVTGKYVHIVLERRVLDRPLAEVRLVNMREEYAEAGPDVVISRALMEAIETRLARGEQVLVLLNRRGYSTAVLCRQCGDYFECPNCSVSLTVHRAHTRWRARCHYCNYTVLVPTSCRKCAAPYLEQTGFGTERVEEHLNERFPAARISRIDRDSIRAKGTLTARLSKFAAGELDIIVGTQMIAKGHDFPHVTLVGVISADVGLGLADFRAAERTFQLLTQVAGRAGRGEQPGEAIVQTLYPDHYSIEVARRQDYPAFFEKELNYRRGMRYPPVVALINTVVRGRRFDEAMQLATEVVARLSAAAESGRFQILGPAPAPLGKLRGEHRVQFFLKGARRAAMRNALREVLVAMPEARRRITVDVDPLTVL